MWKRPKYLRYLHESAFIMFFIKLREINLENFCSRLRWKLRGVCQHIDIRMLSILFKVLRIGNSQFKCNYLKNENHFLKFFFSFWILHQILKILKEKMIAIANVFRKLETVKILVRPLSKERRFRTHLDSEHVKPSQIIAKSPWELFYHVLLSFLGKLIWNISFLVLGEIFGMFVKMLTGDGQYPVQVCENLQLSIQM